MPSPERTKPSVRFATPRRRARRARSANSDPRRRALRLERLEPRVLLDGAGPHDLFAREVFPAGGAYDDSCVADLNRDGAADLVVVNGELKGEISVLLGDGAGHFGPRSVYAAGKYPQSVATADLNGDGFFDIVTGNIGSYNNGFERTVSVLLGRGDGTFSAQTKLDTGGRPRAVALADFTGDGKADILTVNTDDTALSNSYSLLAGAGDGTFAARGDKPLSFSPEDVAAGDLNGDGKQDLVVGRSQAVTVLLGQGGGTFGAGADYATMAAGYVKVAIADTDRDGPLDVVVSGENTGSVSVLLGRGDGTLSLKAEDTAVPRPRGLAVADVSGDAIPDVITASWQDGYVAVRLGGGDGTLAEHVEYWAGGSVSSVAVADFDRDGRADVAADNAGDSYVAVLPGVGGGRFAAPRQLWPTSANSTAVASADLNGDDVADVVTLDPSSHLAAVLLGTGGAAFTGAVEYPIPFNAQTLRLADFNGDGNADLLITNQYQTVTVRLNQGNGSFLDAVSYTVTAGSNSAFLPGFVADVNRDDRPDILVSDTSVSRLYVLYGQAGGTFAAAATLLNQADPLVAVSDFNRDGAMDLVTSQFPTVSLYMGHGDGTFGQPTRYTLGSEGHPTQQIATGDVNGDGNPDLVVTGGLYNGSDRDLWVQLGRGDGSFAAPAMTVLPIAERPAVLKLADVNGDGRDEIITDRGTQAAVFVADAGGSFRLHAEYDISDTVSDVAIADFDGDGAVDLAVPSLARAGVTVLAGYGDGTFGEDFEYSQSGTPSGVAVGDLNGDGNADFVSANGNGHTVSVRLGVGDGGFAAAREFHVGPNPGDVALGDFNRDGVWDVVVTHRDPDVNHPHQFDSVSVAFGTGDGSFGAPLELFVQGVPVAVRAVDLNGDGADDIVTANARSSSYDPVSVLLSNGDRTFQADRSFLAGAADPKDMAVGDLNGDGSADLVTVAGTDTSGTATVVLGGGDGSFAAPVPLTVGRGTQAVALGDLNGDGKLDLVTGNAPSYLNPGASYSVLLGRGDGTFDARVDYAVDGTPQRIGLADMNGDGRLDVVSSNGTDGTFSVWLGNGDGTLTAARSASFAIGNNTNLRAFGIADFDDDGKPDVALADADRTGVAVALQAGPGPRMGPDAGAASPLREEDAAGRVSPRPASWSYGGTKVTGTISANTTWSGVVVVSGPVTVATGVTLTVQPGTTVKYTEGAGTYGSEPGRLELNGTLRVLGTAAQPVIFTSLADDSAGGDTNGDGPASGPNAGDWGPIKFHAGATASAVAYAEIRYAGNWQAAAVEVDGGTPTFTHVTIRDALTRGLTISGTAGGEYSNLIVERSGGTGVAATGSLATSLTDVTIDGTGLALGIGSFGADGIQVSGATTSIHNALISHVPGWAVDMPLALWPNVSGLAIDAATTGHAGAVNVSGTLAADCAPSADVVWSVYGTISAGVTLTLAPGTVLKGGLTVLGALDARGTADQPIIVTGAGDDAAGGDTNGDGDATHPRESISGPRLRFYDTGASGSVLEYVEVRYGGGVNWLGAPYAAVEIEKAAPTLTNLTIRDTDNWALLLKQDAAPIIEHLTVANCIGAGASDGYGVYVKSDAGAFTLSDVSFRRVTNWPLYLESLAAWGRVSHATIDAASCARGAAAYVAGGTLASDVRPAAGVAWQIGNLAVPAGRTLTLDPGTILKSTSTLSVAGSLIALGTPALPVIITVPTDDTAGGDSDGDGGATAPSGSSAPWLAVSSGGAVSLESVELRYRGLDVTSATATVTASQILHAPQQAVRMGGGAGTTADVTVTNSLLIRDGTAWEVVAGTGAAVRLTLVNNTLVGGSYGVLLDESARLERLVNNIIAFNSSAGVGLAHGATASTDVRYNDVYNPGAVFGNYIGTVQDYTGRQGNVSADPRFVNRAGGDFRLGDGSAAIDAADGDVAPLRDRDGLPRFDDWGLPDTGAGAPPYTDMGCHERASDSTSPIDLVVVADSIVAPETATTGETVWVSWTIQNAGTEPAVGPWHDQVSLVRDPQQNPLAIVAGEVLVGDGVTLEPGATLEVSAQVSVPPAASGQYFWQVETNWRQEVREGLKRLNNATLGTVPVQMSVPELVLGQPPTAGAFAADGDARYYAVRMAPGQSLIVTLDDADNEGANDLYVRFGEMPSRSDYDGHTVSGSVADRRLQFTAPFTGYAYVMAYSRQASAVPAAFEITAALAQFSVGELVPASGGNVGRVTVAIRGAALPENAIPCLEGADGQKIFGWPRQWTDATELYATFDLTGQPPGLYDLVLDRADAPAAILHNAFAVEVGTGPRLETNVIAPEEVRRGWLFPITIEWANTGDTDMASPLLRLSNPAALDFGLDPFLESTFGSEVQFVGYSATGPAGVLQPGDRESLTVYSLANAWVSRYDFTLSAIVEEWDNPQPQPIDWAVLEPLYRPPGVGSETQPTAEWDAVWQLFTQDMGATWTDVVRRLADEVTQTGVAPDSLPLVADLMLDSLTRAAGWSGQTTAAVPLYVQTGTPMEAEDGSVSAVEVTFNQALAPTTFTVDDVHLTAPDGTVLPVTVIRRSDRLWRIEFTAPTSAGFYSLLIGPELTDPLGRKLDQDQDGLAGELTDDRYEAGFLLEVPTSPRPPAGEGSTREAEGTPAILSDKFIVTSYSPSGERLLSELKFSSFIVNFNHPVDPSTLTPERIQTGRDIQFTGVTRLSPTQYRLEFQPAIDRSYYTKNRAQVNGPFVIGLSTDVRDTEGQALELGPPYIRVDVQDDLPPQITGTWIGLPETSVWQGMGFDATIADPTAMQLFNGARTLPMGSALPGPVERLYVRLTETIVESTLGPNVTIIGPDGPATVLGVEKIESAHDDGHTTWHTVEGYLIRFTPQTTEGEYTVRIAPGVQDEAQNGLDGGDADAVGGEAEDAYQGTFRIVPVQVFGAADIGADLLTTQSSDGFGVALWEQVGALDPVPGVPLPGDAPDYVVSLTNDLTGTRFTHLGCYAFTKDLAGQPIQNQDPQENGTPRALYVTLLGQHTAGAFIDAATITTVDHSADPMWVALFPDPLPAGKTQQWARLQVVGKSDVKSYPAGETGGPLQVDVRADQLAGYPFRVLSWLSAAANTVERSLHVAPRTPIYLATVVAAPYGEDEYDPAHNMIVVPSHLLNDPLSFWHAYAHALQSAARGYADVPHNPQDAGALWESNSDATAFTEGVASWLAAWFSDQVTPPVYQPAPLSQFRRPQYLQQNDFWMGYDGYGFADNASAADTKLSPGKLRSDGVNDNANTGDNVAGGIATLLWHLGPEFFSLALDKTTAAECYTAVADDSRAAPAFIDQGLAVADDAYEPNDVTSGATPLPVGTTLVDRLILAEADAGRGDWFKLRIPAMGAGKIYALTTRVRFDGRQGDLDLVLRTADGQFVRTDTRRGGDSAMIHLTGLDSSQTYDFLIGVFGHGALQPSGDPSRWGGDFSPYYALQISYPGHILPYRPLFTTTTTAFQSWDPNEKVGPAGATEAGFVHDAAALPYTVYFENDPEKASVPAQRVVVTDQLDTDLNWSTFQFGAIQFGERTLVVPDPVGRLHYETDTTVSYDAYPIHVTADFDPETGVLTWELRSYDPQTGQLPRDLRAGFLPPNDDRNRGAGYVSYSVRPKADLATGTELRNHASIVFDFNDPIVTNEVVYAIDDAAPASAVAALSGSMSTYTFAVSWSGTDAGAGVATYDVYVADNGGAFQPWLTATPATAADYTGLAGHAYAFYSIATDRVGHRETAPMAADASTVIVANPWHKGGQPCDVDGNGRVEPLDVLTLINHINIHPESAALPSSPAAPPPYLDVNNDGACTALDVLMVINYLNAQAAGAGEAAVRQDLAPQSTSAWPAAASGCGGPLAAGAFDDAVPATLGAGEGETVAFRSGRRTPTETPSPRYSGERVGVRGDFRRRVPAAIGDCAEWESLLDVIGPDIAQAWPCV